MAAKDIKSINLLPEFLRTEKNSKFLSSTLDQLINPAQLERIDGYIGSTITPNYVSTSDIYVAESSPLRGNYQLEPACVIKDSLGTVQDVIGIDDLTNEIQLNGGYPDNFDRLYRSSFYSYDPHIDWDKFVNYQNYYWLVNGPDNVVINNTSTQVLNIETDILTTSSYTYNGIDLLNGMKLRFLGNVSPESYQGRDFFVEGVGSVIKLVPYDDLNSSEDITTLYIDHFDADPFDDYPFDGYKNLPENIEYVTINRASKDLNSWSRYNRWVHKDVIKISAAASDQQPVYPSDKRARRPIIEFKADLKLYNYGSVGIPDIDLIDTTTTDAFNTVEGSAGYYVDGVLLEQGHKVIFTADTDSTVRSKIYQVNYVVIQNTTRLTLEEIAVPAAGSVTSAILGNDYAGTSWWYDGDTWIYAQQHTTINQAPLFDLFDNQGNSYSDITYYKSDFAGNKIFGYEIGTIYDPILQFKIKYRNSVGTGSYLFKNYFMTDTISISVDSQTTKIISTGITYCKLDNEYVNVWSGTDTYPIPTLVSPETGDTYYEPPLGLTNNPLNGSISSLTLSEIADHVNNSQRRLISNINPLAFAQIFIGKKEHNLIDAIDKAAEQYNQYKLAFLRKITKIDNQTDPVAAVDQVLNELNADKDTLSPYYLSDMTPYGTDKIVRTWTVTNSRNKIYSITTDYDPLVLSMRAVLVYLNGSQLIHDIEYQFEVNDSSVKILVDLAVGDTIVINDYTNTVGNFVPSTPTKLGLYPKYIPKIFNDTTYVDQDTMVIQGHDGSLMIAYNDYRDDIILEFEKRIFNNIKASYRNELLDYNTVIPGAFRATQYTQDEIKGIINGDFNNWAGIYGIEITSNSSFDEGNPYTWNYTNTYNSTVDTNLTGSWRAIYKYFYDTDRPHTAPWEMLGFTIEPDWWSTLYGPAPYTSGNSLLWEDLSAGRINGVVNPLYVREGLLDVIPVDEFGDLLDPTELIVQDNSITPGKIRSLWTFNQQGPAETAWRRSSYWPFVLQKLLALTKPADYAALLYDPIRLTKNIADQWTYGDDHQFLSPDVVKIHGNGSDLTTGYSVFVSEAGRQRTGNYIQELKSDLAYVDFNLFYKVGGFISKNKMQIIIDAIDPTSSSSGAILPPEDYNLILNTSNPVKVTAISGIIVQKSNGKFIVRGYDNYRPYFNVYPAVRNATTPTITVGGVSQPYVLWKSSSSGGSTGLTDVDVTTAQSATYGVFYQQGQIVSYGDRFYRVKINHKSGDTFNANLFQLLPSLPINGGVSVQTAIRYDKKVVQIPYGTEFDKIQEVYDLIVGYGAWLEDQGFIFDQFNNDLQTILDWKFSGNEFLFWTTQNWADNSVITLSPFADQVKFYSADSVVDNIFDNFYHRAVLQVNGKAIRHSNLSVNRDNGTCTIRTSNTPQGIYFVVLNNVQKEHAMVFNNTTMFNDTIYDVETGYRQRRMKLVGFRTAGWNGDYFSPGFIYDTAVVDDWKTYTDYRYADVVRFNGNYYSANKNIPGDSEFDFTKWTVLRSKPTADLIPNFDYKISQFEDFYSLDIDNFDSAQQKMAQHLTGYTPRVYLNNIFTNPISQYKFYQGYIKEKGTRNSIAKLAKASIHNLQGDIDYTEEWAFRVGHYGSYETFKELEVSLVEGKFIENPQIIKFIDSVPSVPNDLIYYSTSTSWSIVPTDYVATTTFVTTSSTDMFQLPIAGYVNFDDVNYTAYNETAVLSIQDSGTLIKRGDTVWVAAKKNNDWGVFRYTLSSSRIIGASVEDGTTGELTLKTDKTHYLSKGDIIAIYECDSRIDGIYIVKSVSNKITEFVIDYPTPNAITELASTGLLFKFVNSRYSLYDELPSDNTLLQFPVKTKLWVDDDGSGNWVVYQKVKNYNRYSIAGSNSIANEKLGWSLTKAKNSNIFMVGATGYKSTNNTGTVFVYAEKYDVEKNKGSVEVKIRYNLNTNSITYHAPGGNAEFGYSLAYDDRDFIGVTGSSGYGIFFAGAPGASGTKSNDFSSIRYAYNTGTVSTSTQEGLVKISSIDPLTNEEYTQRVLLSPNPSSYERFGHSLYVQQTETDDGKLLLVGAPQIYNQGTGHVYAYLVTTSTVTTGTIDLSYVESVTTSSVTLASGDRWGYSISGSDDAGVIAIGAPGHSNNAGIVSIFTGTSLTYIQTISSPFGDHSKFGEVVKVSSDGSYLFVSAIDARGTDQSYGKVAVYTLTNHLFVLDSVLENPLPTVGMKFGQAIDINNNNTELVISAIGKNKHIITTFDTYKDLLSSADQPDPTTPYAKNPDSATLAESTTFDADSTVFYDSSNDSGSVYIYNRKTNKFRLTYELVPVNASSGTNYGYSVAVNDNSIYVGAPAYSSDTPGAVHQFYKIDTESDSLQAIRKQNQLVDLNTVQKISIIDSFNEEVIDYLDTIDPVKGKIAGQADQDVRYKSLTDPAIYSTGTSATVNNTDINWLDSHVGELWWDLSTVKYVWYEQADVTYRKNNWGRVFPGSSIDIYEWVGTPYLPSEWSQIADTVAGLSQGISGQPKYPDDSVVSIKQVYNSATLSFENRYYFWVKNKVTLPNTKNRRITANQIASIIANPTLYGLKYAAIIDQDSMMLSNLGDTLVDDRIHININYDIINNPIPLHTEWLLLQEGLATSRPNTLLEKKLFDSLLGHDSLGNPVPDPALSSRARYGISIRPRQTLFKNRSEAIRNIVEFSNGVLITNRITGNYSFANLNKQETVPYEDSHRYDEVVEDNEGLLTVDTRNFVKAEISCEIENGRIVTVNIDNPGYGYKISPLVKLPTDSLAEIKTIIDQYGSVIDTEIVNAGSKFTTAPVLQVRSYTVIVLADAENNGKWSEFVYDVSTSTWSRIHTQQYNTTIYWDYRDWISPDYNPFVDYAYTVDEIYELESLEDLQAGDYVKIKNGGLGYYIIVERVLDGMVGDFSEQFNIVYSENGTIQILDTVWDFANSNLNFDQVSSYDQTLYDQTPDTELNYILIALRDDLFINDLKVNWNYLFFKAVKYALSEQKLLDWAFKTSFINVVNNAGTLDQRTVYKLQNTEYFEDYIKEVKPYHTNIRSFTSKYSVLEPTGSYNTDFDLPSYYDKNTNQFTSIEILASESSSTFTITNTLTNVYPWKSWTDNYLTSGTVRTNLIGMKFDRVSRGIEIENLQTVDTFICNGSDNSFVLSWEAEPDKSKITVTLGGALVLGLDYSITYYDEDYGQFTGEYRKNRSKIVFLNYTPPIGQTLVVSYYKKTSLLNAADRVLNFYTATAGMPGLDLGQLMTGIVYPKTRVEGLMFDYATDWDVYTGYDSSSYADSVGFYTSTTSSSASSSVGGTWTSIHLSSIAGVSIGQYVNVSSTVTQTFTTATVQVVDINTSTNLVIFNTTTFATISTGSSIEFWTLDSEMSILDSAIEGGTWNTSTRVGALGINPEDITIDGDGFITANTSYAPEELVPGEVNESLGINVYTKNPQGGPIVLSSYVNVVAGTTTTQTLGIVPPSADNIIVTFNNNIFTYITGTNFTASTYTIDWAANQIVLPPQAVSGNLGYTIVSIGGGRPDQEAGVIDSSSVSVIGTSTVQAQSLSSYQSVKSAYVTLNGQKIESTGTGVYYELTYANSINRRAAVNVHRLPTDKTNTVTAWFFGTYNKYFNEVKEETFTITGSTYYTLSYPPGNIEPVAEEAIVELYDPATGQRNILRPPHTDYYKVVNLYSTTFPINNTGTYTLGSSLRVYVNGIELKPGFEYSVVGGTQVSINFGICQVNDVVAVLSKPATPNYDYDIVGNVLSLEPGFSTSKQIKVITYNNHDNMFIRTEQFIGLAGRRYQISRPALNDNYVWVIVNGIPLVNKLDYEILDDLVTVQISSRFEHTASDKITIISISDSPLATTVLGYRVFNDIFNRTHFKRLSKQNTTYLTQPLSFTDTEIYVADASVLTPPLVAKNMPGVVIIDGERIEFFTVTGNVLGQLRRSTLGTAPSFYSEENTKVIDQGLDQTVPYKENIYKQVLLTSTSTNTYSISSIDYVANTGTYHQYINDGITFSTNLILQEGQGFISNQIDVRYGGRKLNKTGTFHQDITVSYDSPRYTSIGTTSTVDLLPSTTVMGQGYIVEDTNQVWIYENSVDSSSVNGYVYRGLDYQPPEFTVEIIDKTMALNFGIDAVKMAIGVLPEDLLYDLNGDGQVTLTDALSYVKLAVGYDFTELGFTVNTESNASLLIKNSFDLILNIDNGVQGGIKLVVTKKDLTTVWNDIISSDETKSLMVSSTTQAKFLQLRPAELPDKYYYGGDPGLVGDDGYAITTDEDQPLEGN